MQIPGGPRCKYSPQYTIQGHHFADLESAKFFELSVNYENLTSWAELTGISRNVYFSEQGNKIRGEDFKFEYPEKLQYEFEEYNVSFEIRFGSTAQSNHSFSYEEWTVFTITTFSDRKLSFLFGDLSVHFQDLLTFCVGVGCHPKFVFAKSREVFIRDRKTDEVIYKSLRIYPSYSKHFNIRKKKSDSFLVKFKTIQEEFQNLFLKWQDEKTSLEPIFNLYLSNIYNERQYFDIKFVNMVQGLESFHRRVLGGRYVKKKEYKEIKKHFVEAIPEYLPKEFKECLPDKFNFLHEYSLKKRLEELVNYTNPYFTNLIGDVDKFIKNVKDSRN